MIWMCPKFVNSCLCFNHHGYLLRHLSTFCNYETFLTENRPFHLPRLPRWNVDPLMWRSVGKDLERPLSTQHMT